MLGGTAFAEVDDGVCDRCGPGFLGQLGKARVDIQEVCDGPRLRQRLSLSQRAQIWTDLASMNTGKR